MAALNEEASKLLVRELNETKLAPMVFTIAKRCGDIPPGSKISSFRVKSITNTECQVSYVTCRGDTCDMPKTATYKFRPPLDGNKIFLLKLQSDICAPKFHWLFTKPLALFILILCIALSIGAMGMGVDGMTENLAKYPALENGVTAVFGSPKFFSWVILGAWCIAVLVHFIECAVAYRICERSLRFSNEISSAWGLLIFMVGYPVFQELLEIHHAKNLHAKSK